MYYAELQKAPMHIVYISLHFNSHFFQVNLG